MWHNKAVKACCSCGENKNVEADNVPETATYEERGQEALKKWEERRLPNAHSITVTKIICDNGGSFR